MTARIALIVAALLGAAIPVRAQVHQGKAPGPQLTYIQMIDRIHGWGLTSSAVLRTTNGGATWKDVSPHGFSIERQSAGAFLDAQHAWVSASRPSTVAPVILRTEDGGATWQATTLAAAPGTPLPLNIGQITFIDAQHGWLLADLGAGAGSEGVEIFHSTDGGRHWVTVSVTAGAEGSTPGSLPLGGLKSGLTFRDTFTGWATGVSYASAASYVFLYVTYDRGHTWRHQQIIVPAAYGQGQSSINPPRSFTPADGVLPVMLRGPRRPAVDFYATHDGGCSWSSTTPLPYDTTAAPLSWDFVDPYHGWAAWGRKLYVTMDGGQHWNAITPNVSLAGVEQLDFVSLRVGWALGGTMRGTVTRAFLLKTTDGGHTWSVVLRG